jgi:hypothetical protein
MPSIIPKKNNCPAQITLAEYRKEQMGEVRWKNVTKGVSCLDLDNNFEFLNAAVLNRSVGESLLLTTTGLFGPIRSGTCVHLDADSDADSNSKNMVIQSENAPTIPELDLITRLNNLHNERTGKPPTEANALPVNAYWNAAVDGAGITGLDDAANVFGSTGQLICDVDELKFPLLSQKHPNFIETLHYYGGTLLGPKEEFALGFSQDLWGIQYDQKQPEYITKYQFGPTKGGGLFVEHHPFPHIWLPANSKDSVFGGKTVSRILLGRRLDSNNEDGYYRTVKTQQFHFTMFEIPLDGSALAIRPQCIHNDSFTQGAQTVFLANTPANTVALRHGMPITKISACDNYHV